MPIYKAAQGLSLREVVELVKACKQQAQPPAPHWECAAGIQRSAGLEQIWSYKFCPQCMSFLFWLLSIQVQVVAEVRLL